MASEKAAWGIEVGADAIKAVRLERDGDRVVVSDFAVVPHKKVLTTPDLDANEMVRLSLGQFISQKSLEGEHMVMSVPGHAAFARFAKLPPVEPKKVADIVKFEAVQQIPFPIDEVEWDYQTFTSEDSPEVEVGIFAITRERVQQRLELYGELGVSPEALTLSPVALFNAMSYDLDLAGTQEPIIILDIGTQATDVIIAEEGRCWIRTFPLGGTHFTEAIASAFKLSYAKAEKLKKEASTSKYFKQIMQAMRPVFSDLLQDLQRSIGYYQSLHRERDLTTVIGVGSTFKIPGLRKFIGQQLQINVVRLDEFKKIAVTGREAASFAENTVNLATAYGLALQGVALAPIDVNLVPVKALREQMWHAKTKWFAAAAAIVGIGAATTLYHPITQKGEMNPSMSAEASRVLQRGEKLKKDLQAVESERTVGGKADNMRRLTDYRRVWPYLVHDASDALAAADPQPILVSGRPEVIREVDPAERRLVALKRLDGQYFAPDGANDPRTISVTMFVELSRDKPEEFLNSTVAAWFRENREPEGDRADVPYRITNVSLNLAQMETIQVSDSGQESASGGGNPGSSGGNRGAGSPGASDPGGFGGDRRSSPPVRKPPGARDQSPPLGGNPGAPGAGPSGRRKPPANTRRPPGPGGGFGGVPGGAGNPGSAPGNVGNPGAAPGGNTDRNRSRGSEEATRDIDASAPMPMAPPLYPPGSTFYRVPITFDVEIIDPDKPKPAGEDVARADENGEVPS